MIARGSTTRTLGSRPLARAPFTLSPRTDGVLRLRLSPAARHALSRGPLYVTAVLRGAASPTSVNEVAKRPETLAVERPFASTQEPTAVRAVASFDCWPNARCTDFTWSWKIPKAHYLVMNRFSCPAEAPRVAPGRAVPVQGRKYKWWDTFKGSMEASASDGVGYAGFHQPTVIEFDDSEARFRDDATLYNMLGWPQGDLLQNSVWAPLFSDGTFSLKVTCTTATTYGAAYLAGNNSKLERGFFPW